MIVLGVIAVAVENIYLVENVLKKLCCPLLLPFFKHPIIASSSVNVLYTRTLWDRTTLKAETDYYLEKIPFLTCRLNELSSIILSLNYSISD